MVEIIGGFFLIVGILAIIGATHNLIMEIFVYSKQKGYSSYFVNEAEHSVNKKKSYGGGGPG